MRMVITDTIFDEFPELVLGVVILHNIDNSLNRAGITEMLRREEAALPGKLVGTPVIEHPYIATWREAYRKFGAKPKDYPSSVENLTRRVLNGATIAHINNLRSILRRHGSNSISRQRQSGSQTQIRRNHVKTPE